MTAAKQRAINIIESLPDNSDTVLEVVRILESVVKISEIQKSDASDSEAAFESFKSLCKPAPEGFDYDYDRVKLEAMEEKYGSIS